jgi:hypothetical protein
MNAGAQSAHALIENNGLGNPTFRVSGGLPPIRKLFQNGYQCPGWRHDQNRLIERGTEIAVNDRAIPPRRQQSRA